MASAVKLDRLGAHPGTLEASADAGPFARALERKQCMATPSAAAIALAEQTFQDPEDLASLAALCAYEATAEGAMEISVVSVQHFAALLLEPQITVTLPPKFSGNARSTPPEEMSNATEESPPLDADDRSDAGFGWRLGLFGVTAIVAVLAGVGIVLA